MTASFKMVLLGSLPTTGGAGRTCYRYQLAQTSWELLHRQPPLLADLPDAIRTLSGETRNGNVVGGKTRSTPGLAVIQATKNFPHFSESTATISNPISSSPLNSQIRLSNWFRKLIDFRLTTYEACQAQQLRRLQILPFLAQTTANRRVLVPTSDDLWYACGYLRTQYRRCWNIDSTGFHGQLDPVRHFIARAIGNSMNGGKHPIP